MSDHKQHQYLTGNPEYGLDALDSDDQDVPAPHQKESEQRGDIQTLVLGSLLGVWLN